MKLFPNFADIATPLRTLLKKDATFEWTSECQHAFEKLKAEIHSNRVLAHFNSNAKTIVSTDASGFALGAVLSQLQDGKERPIPFASRTLAQSEQAYSVGEPEALGFIWACEH